MILIFFFLSFPNFFFSFAAFARSELNTDSSRSEALSSQQKSAVVELRSSPGVELPDTATTKIEPCEQWQLIRK